MITGCDHGKIHFKKYLNFNKSNFRLWLPFSAQTFEEWISCLCWVSDTKGRIFYLKKSIFCCWLILNKNVNDRESMSWQPKQRAYQENWMLSSWMLPVMRVFKRRKNMCWKVHQVIIKIYLSLYLSVTLTFWLTEIVCRLPACLPTYLPA